MEKNYSAWNIPFNHFFDFRHSPARERLKFLVRFAVLAPSSHNSQPWKFVVNDTEIKIIPDPSRALPVSDPFGRHLAIAMGCAMENIMIAADYYGLRATVEYPEKGSRDITARIIFQSTNSSFKNKSDSHLALMIPRRLVNRNPYRSDMPESSFLKKAFLLMPEGINIDIVSDHERKNAITDILLESGIQAFSRRDFRGEMADYKRNNLTRSGTGITGITMGFNTPLSLVASFFIRNFNVMKALRRSEENLLKKETPVFVFISSKGSAAYDWFLAGRALESFMLEAEAHGLSTAIRAIPPDTAMLRKIIGTTFNPQIFLRLGYADKIPPHSPRLSADEVVEFTD